MVGHVEFGSELLSYGLQLLLQMVSLLFQWQTADIKLLSHLLGKFKTKRKHQKSYSRPVKWEVKPDSRTICSWQIDGSLFPFNYTGAIKELCWAERGFQKIKWHDCHEMTRRLVQYLSWLRAIFMARHKNSENNITVTLSSLQWETAVCIINTQRGAENVIWHSSQGFNRWFGNSDNPAVVFNSTKYSYF